jgi:predicted NBD/HSP70 family sugar kinase
MLGLLRRYQPLSRAELARITGFFRSSVSDIVDSLIAEDLVAETKQLSSGRGRAPIGLHLNDESYPVLGLTIRPKFCQLAYAGLTGHIQRTWNFETPSSPKALVRSVEKAILTAKKQLKIPLKNEFRKIGVAIPGHVDALVGKILWTPTHPELADFPIAAELARAIGIPVLADNDANLGALSELWSSSASANRIPTDFVFLNVSDFGAGAGIVLNGKIYLGHDGHFAGEFGHMVVERNGLPCRCGRRGCWELYVSNSVTWNRYRPRSPFTVERFEQMLTAAEGGDTTALHALRVTAEYISLGISNIGFAVNPAEVIVAGRITRIWEKICRVIEEEHCSARVSYKIRPAALSSDDSLLHGAVCLALRDVFAAPQFGQTNHAT